VSSEAVAGGRGIPDALLWDFDGVLADTERVHHTSWNATLEPYGIQFTWEEYLKQCVGVADPIVARLLNLPDPERAVAEKQQRLREGLAANPPFLPATVRLLAELAERFRMAVVSSSFRREILPAIEAAGLAPYFETIITGDDAQHLKPAPDLYLLAVARLGVRSPLVIEDSDSGVAAGVAAGLEVLRVSAVDRVAEEVRARLAG
jgi:HAD superfamily hydrolase (TIGR01509 family)